MVGMVNVPLREPVVGCTNGRVIGLYAAKQYEPEFGPVAEGFRGIVLSIYVGSFDEVKAVHTFLSGVEGADVLEGPIKASWGAGFAWRDPEGNDWDVAWARDATFDERGGVFFP